MQSRLITVASTSSPSSIYQVLVVLNSQTISPHTLKIKHDEMNQSNNILSHGYYIIDIVVGFDIQRRFGGGASPPPGDLKIFKFSKLIIKYGSF